MNSKEFVRRTRKNNYYRKPDGTMEAEFLRSNVTDYSYVISQPIEYKKPRAARKTPSKRFAKKSAQNRAQLNVPAFSIPTKFKGCRVNLVRIAERMPKEYPTIDLEKSMVPKPKKGELKNVPRP